MSIYIQLYLSNNIFIILYLLISINICIYVYLCIYLSICSHLSVSTIAFFILLAIYFYIYPKFLTS